MKHKLFNEKYLEVIYASDDLLTIHIWSYK